MGGGISSILEAKKLFDAGADKVSLNTAALENPKLIEELAENKNLKIIDKPFTIIKQSIGIKKGSVEATKFLNDFILKIISEGIIERLLKKHKLENKLCIPKIY